MKSLDTARVGSTVYMVDNSTGDFHVVKVKKIIKSNDKKIISFDKVQHHFTYSPFLKGKKKCDWIYCGTNYTIFVDIEDAQKLSESIISKRIDEITRYYQ